MKSYKVRIAIPIGDPSGIGPEIVRKTVASIDKKSKIDLTSIGQVSAMQAKVEACDISFSHRHGNSYLIGE